MPAGAAEWVWEHSRAQNGPLILLLAVANEIDKTGNCIMSVAEMATRTRLSERAVQNAVRELERLGELKVTPKAGGHGRNGYALTVHRGADSAPLPASRGADIAPPQNLHPAESAPQPEVKPQVNAKGADSAPRTIPDALSSSVVSGKRSKSKAVSETPREDVDRLCEHLASRIVANGSNRPNITKRWKDAARLMLDNDGRREQDVHKAIDWCQGHHFWHRQILSMEKLRAQYDRLVLDAKAERNGKPRQSRQPSDEDYADELQMARALDAQETM